MSICACACDAPRESTAPRADGPWIDDHATRSCVSISARFIACAASVIATVISVTITATINTSAAASILVTAFADTATSVADAVMTVVTTADVVIPDDIAVVTDDFIASAVVTVTLNSVISGIAIAVITVITVAAATATVAVTMTVAAVAAAIATLTISADAVAAIITVASVTATIDADGIATATAAATIVLATAAAATTTVTAIAIIAITATATAVAVGATVTIAIFTIIAVTTIASIAATIADVATTNGSNDMADANAFTANAADITTAIAATAIVIAITTSAACVAVTVAALVVVATTAAAVYTITIIAVVGTTIAAAVRIVATRTDAVTLAGVAAAAPSIDRCIATATNTAVTTTAIRCSQPTWRTPCALRCRPGAAAAVAGSTGVTVVSTKAATLRLRGAGPTRATGDDGAGVFPRGYDFDAREGGGSGGSGRRERLDNDGGAAASVRKERRELEDGTRAGSSGDVDADVPSAQIHVAGGGTYELTANLIRGMLAHYPALEAIAAVVGTLDAHKWERFWRAVVWHMNGEAASGYEQEESDARLWQIAGAGLSRNTPSVAGTDDNCVEAAIVESEEEMSVAGTDDNCAEAASVESEEEMSDAMGRTSAHASDDSGTDDEGASVGAFMLAPEPKSGRESGLVSHSPVERGYSGGQVRVAWWNARDWNGAGEKLTWLRERLDETHADVFFVVEASLRLDGIIGLRRGLKSFTIKWLPGDGEDGAGGIVAGVRDATSRWVGKPRRPHGAARVLALTVRHAGVPHAHEYACIHGSEDASIFAKQLKAVQSVAAMKHALVVGDFNRVPFTSWRMQRHVMNEGDRALAQWLGAPGGVELVGGDGNADGVAWTRYKTRKAANGRSVWGAPTSRIDYAVASGDTRWRLVEAIPAEVLVDDAEGQYCRPLSDHIMQVAGCEIPVGLQRERRPRGLRIKHNSALSSALQAELGCELASEIALVTEAARLQGQSACRAAAQQMTAIANDVDANLKHSRQRNARAKAARCGGLVAERQSFNDWKAMLHEALKLRDGGVRASDVESGSLFHHKRGLRGELAKDWSAVLRRCRREVRRAARAVAWRANAEDRQLANAAEALLKIPSDQMEQRQRAAFQMLYKSRTSATVDGAHEGDDPKQAFVPASADRFPEVTAAIGTACVRRLDRGANVVAFQAWCDVFVGQMAVLTGLSGLEWNTRSELTFPLFCAVVRRFPIKAVGAGGFTVALLQLASTEVKREVWAAMVGDVDDDTHDPDWRRVMYVLLAKKPPNRPNVIAERREIALMAQEMKIVLQMVRKACYSRVAGRLHASAVGWLPSYGTTDVGISAVAAVDQARILGHDLYLLFLDQATFFSIINREALKVAELCQGLPPEVIHIAARIYGTHEADPDCCVCQHDSSGGLGGKFANWMGSLMGCVLSTEKARLFLNTLVVAIAAVAKGIKLWGGGLGGGWTELLQIVLADDWLGVFDNVGQLRKAWAALSTWEVLVGTEIGIKAADKTVLTGIIRRKSADTSVSGVTLRTADGRTVPTRGKDTSYKHAGRYRRADGSCVDERAHFTKHFNTACSRLKAMRNPSRWAFMTVSEALLVGSGGFYLQTLHLTWTETDALEARWRGVANLKLRRAHDSPRAELYERLEEGLSPRTHLYAVGLSAKMAAGCKAMADLHPTDQRNAARSALLLAAARWGCRERLDTWTMSSGLLSEMERSLGDEHYRGFGESWLLAWGLLERTAAEDENVTDTGERRFVETQAEGALSAHMPPPSTPRLFGADLKLPERAELLHAGVVAVGHMVRQRVDGKWEVAPAAGAVSRGIISDTAAARKAWDETAALLRDKLTYAGGGYTWTDASGTPVAIAAERVTRLREHWEPSSGAEDARSVEKAAAELQQQLGAEEHSRRGWTQRVREAFRGVRAVGNSAEWAHGLVDARELAQGPRVFGDAREARGGEAWWESQHAEGGLQLGDDGFAKGWQSHLEALTDMYHVDDEAYVTDDIGRIEVERCDELPPALQMLVRARHALGRCEVRARTARGDDGKKQKSSKRCVSVEEAGENLHAACTWHAKLQPTHTYTVDGGKVEITHAQGHKTTAYAYAVVRHDGVELGASFEPGGNTIHALGLRATSYLAELGAQIRALQDAGGGARAMIWHDARSPVDALLKFKSRHARHKQGVYARGWLETGQKAAQHLACVIYQWQTSHVGSPANEYADASVTSVAQSGHVHGIPADYSFASVRLPYVRGSVMAWAKERAVAIVRDKLRSSVVNTLVHGEHDVRLGVLTDEAAAAIAAARARRWAVGDEGYRVRDRDRLWRGGLGCGHSSCGAGRCDVFHMVYECQRPSAVEQREVLRDKCGTLLAAAEEQVGFHQDIRDARSVLAAAAQTSCKGRVAHLRRIIDGARSERSDQSAHGTRRRRALLRTVTGLVEVPQAGKEIRRLVTEVTRVTARLLTDGRKASSHSWALVEKRAQNRKAWTACARLMHLRIAEGGPLRAARLRRLRSHRALVAGDSVTGDGAVPQRRFDEWAAREQTVALGLRPKCIGEAYAMWWAYSRIMAWRIRARRRASRVRDERAALWQVWREGGGAACGVSAAAMRGATSADLPIDVEGGRKVSAHAAASGPGYELETWATEPMRTQYMLSHDEGTLTQEWESRRARAAEYAEMLRRRGRPRLVQERRRRREGGGRGGVLERWYVATPNVCRGGAVNVPERAEGSWDDPTSNEERATSRRQRKAARFAAIKGNAYFTKKRGSRHLGPLWRCDVLRVRAMLGGRRGAVEALLHWAGTGTDEAVWTPVGRALMPQRQMRADALRMFAQLPGATQATEGPARRARKRVRLVGARRSPRLADNAAAYDSDALYEAFLAGDGAGTWEMGEEGDVRDEEALTAAHGYRPRRRARTATGDSQAVVIGSDSGAAEAVGVRLREPNLNEGHDASSAGGGDAAAGAPVPRLTGVTRARGEQTGHARKRPRQSRARGLSTAAAHAADGALR